MNVLPKREMKISSTFPDLIPLYATRSILISHRFTLHTRS